MTSRGIGGNIAPPLAYFRISAVITFVFDLLARLTELRVPPNGVVVFHNRTA